MEDDALVAESAEKFLRKPGYAVDVALGWTVRIPPSAAPLVRPQRTGDLWALLAVPRETRVLGEFPRA